MTDIPFRFGDDWWQRGVVYQIYPRSYADSDGDGTGDLPGIIKRLAHLGPDGLGVDAIWLSPIYPSPGIDVGYDVSDHSSIDPRFGSDEDFDNLVAEAHRLGIRIVLDLVMNHTSDEHPWFVASRQRIEPYTDWYLWRDPGGVGPNGRPLPPNNWVSWFGGRAWTFDPVRGQSYHHTFLAEQPELDWRIPAVEAAQWAMVRGWLERGVDGFRLDTFNVFLKHPALPSNPIVEGSSDWTRQEHRFDIDQPDLPELLARFRSLVDGYPARMSVGELFAGSTEDAAALTAERHLVFDWELLTRPWLRLGDDVRDRNVQAQSRDPHSVLSCYRRVLAARRQLPTLQDGVLRLLASGDPDVLAYRRVGSGPDVLVAVAFREDGGSLTLPVLPTGVSWRPVVGTHAVLPTAADGAAPLALRGYEGIILVASGA